MRTRAPSSRSALLAALAACLSACAMPRPAPSRQPAAVPAPPVDYVNAGIYETTDPSDPAARVVLFLSPNHGFILRHSRKREGLVEYRGRWSSDPDSLRLVVWDRRHAAAGDSARRVVRLDTVISCPIASGAIQPLPLLRLGSPKGGPRLITLAKPPGSPAWDAAKARQDKGGKKKKAKKGETRTKTAKAGSAPPKSAPGTEPEGDVKGRKEAPPAPPAARTGA